MSIVLLEFAYRVESFVSAHNSRSFAERSRKLGWVPSRPSAMESLENDVTETLKNL